MMKLRVGPVTYHNKESTGGESNVLNHYATTSETSYGKQWSHLEPRVGRHSGAGYVPNIRPCVSYSANMDVIDNPHVGRVIANNYMTVTQRDFKPSTRASGKEYLPESTYFAGSGFVREKPIHSVPSNEILNAFINTRCKTVPGLLPSKQRPLLYNIQPSGPIDKENGGYGPNAMSTEYTTRYMGTPWEKLNLRRSLGPKEGTGFVHNRPNFEPVTYEFTSPHSNCRPAYMTHRPIGNTMHSSFYRPLTHLYGGETLPSITKAGNRRTGFVIGNQAVPDFVEINPLKVYTTAADMTSPRLEKLRKSNPSEYFTATNPNQHASTMRDFFKGEQNPPKTQAAELGRSDVGPLCGTGHTANTPGYVPVPENVTRFITHSSTKFFDPTLQGAEREGHLSWNLQSLKPDGYTKSTQVHTIEPQAESMGVLRQMQPYQARSVIARESMSTAPNKCIAINMAA